MTEGLITPVELEGMDAGLQPLDTLLTRLSLTNNTLVEHSTEQLTHKVVQKGRKGRKITRNAQQKILRALNGATATAYTLEQLFNYRGR